MLSPDDPDVLYTSAQYVFESKDHGKSWQTISPDLTRNDKSKQLPSGGPLTKDITSVEYYDTVFSLAESPLKRGLLTPTGRRHQIDKFKPNRVAAKAEFLNRYLRSSTSPLQKVFVLDAPLTSEDVEFFAA